MPEQTFSPPFAEQVREQHRSVVAALANLDALFSKLKGHLSTYASMNREAEINYIVSQDAQFFRYIEPNAPYRGEMRRDNADSRLKRFSIMLCASYPISRVDIQAYKGAEKSIFDYDVSPYINLTKNTDICDLYESYFAYLRRAQYIQIERDTPLYKSPDENYSRIPLKQDSVSYSIPFYILPGFSAVVIAAFPRKNSQNTIEEMLDEFSRIIYGNIYTNESFDADYQKLCLLNHIDKSLIHTLNLYEVYKACNISTVIFKRLFFNGTRLYGESACNFSYNLIRFLESVLPQECTSNILVFCKQFESVFRVAQNTLFNDYIMICLGRFLFSFHNDSLDMSQTAKKERNAEIFMEQSDNFIGQINKEAEHFFCEWMNKLSLSLYDFKKELNQELNTIINSQMYNPTLLPIYQLLLDATKND